MLKHTKGNLLDLAEKAAEAALAEAMSANRDKPSI